MDEVLLPKIMVSVFEGQIFGMIHASKWDVSVDIFFQVSQECPTKAS
jgi:hypothetical protein